MRLFTVFTFLLVLFIQPVQAADQNAISIEKYYFKTAPVQYKKTRIYVLLKSGSSDFEGNVTLVYTQNGTETPIIKNRPLLIIANDHAGIFADVTFTQTGRVTLKVLTQEGSDPVQSVSPSTPTDIKADTDRDGISDDIDPDDDNDGLSDSQEVAAGTIPTNPDTDGDGFSDSQDTFPLDKTEHIDTDSDGIGDNKDPDDDNDGLTNVQEKELGTNPLVADTDKDGVSDKVEVENRTNPLNPDTDGDGVPDNTDIAPLDSTKAKDTDGDGISDGQETANNLDPHDSTDGSKDSDTDGLSNADEVNTYHTNPHNPDSDGDGIPDGTEVTYGLQPTDKTDGAKDSDGDGVTNTEEVKLGLNPFKPKSFGIPDGFMANIRKNIVPIVFATGSLSAGGIFYFVKFRKKRPSGV